MHDFISYCLRQFNRSTHWNDDNQYSNLSAASRAILDFTPADGFTFHLAKATTPLFKSSYRLQTFPLSSGSIGYLFTSRPQHLTQTAVHLDRALERIRPVGSLDEIGRAQTPPNFPEHAVLRGLLGICQVGAWNPMLYQTSVDRSSPLQGHYLLCSQLFLPSGRVEGLYARRLSPRTQFLAVSVSSPTSQSSEMLTQWQYDCSKWCAELSFSTPDYLFGMRGLYNFGAVPEEPAIEDLRSNPGHMCVGGEVYFSTKQQSGGLSVGFRHRTLFPKAAELTCVTNPVMGHISSAYTASITSDCIMSTRFDFNVYSFYSDLTTGIEWHNSRDSIVKVSLSTAHGLTMGLDCRYRKILLSFGASLGSQHAGGRPTVGTTLPSSTAIPSLTSPLRSLGVHVQFFS
ncbi:Mitochondrial distribution and morphology protein 10 [Dispira simplex]|nr:Mitochondrial distribution and morphology protein 10 [Dispira simplex]